MLSNCCWRVYVVVCNQTGSCCRTGYNLKRCYIFTVKPHIFEAFISAKLKLASAFNVMLKGAFKFRKFLGHVSYVLLVSSFEDATAFSCVMTEEV